MTATHNPNFTRLNPLPDPAIGAIRAPVSAKLRAKTLKCKTCSGKVCVGRCRFEKIH